MDPRELTAEERARLAGRAEAITVMISTFQHHWDLSEKASKKAFGIMPSDMANDMMKMFVDTGKLVTEHAIDDAAKALAITVKKSVIGPHSMIAEVVIDAGKFKETTGNFEYRGVKL
jgi:hypothetical protein